MVHFPPPLQRAALVVLGVVGWIGLAVIAVRMLATDPPSAGFDLKLILEAGERVAAGMSPYDPAMVAGTADLEAVDLFYSYPPPVAQAASLVAGLPLAVAVAGLWVMAVAGWAHVVDRLGRARGSARRRVATGLAVAVVPLVFPFAIGLLFGNLSTLYPIGYGLLLVGLLVVEMDGGGGRSVGGRRAVIVGGLAIGLLAIAKIHPGAVLAWLLVRGVVERRAGGSSASWWAAGAALIVAVTVVAGSVALYGIGPWQDYVAVLRSASAAGVLLEANAGPVATIVGWLGGDEAAVRLLQPVVVGLAIVVTVVAAWRVRDTTASLAVAAAASLLILPITWLHYPTALLPFAAAALLVAGDPVATPDRRALLAVAAGVAAALAIVAPPLLWVAVALVLVLAGSAATGVARLAPDEGPRGS